MIPGNRPEDEWCEKFWDGVVIPDGITMLNPEFSSTVVSIFLEKLDEAVRMAFKVGQSERAMDILAEEVFGEPIGSKKAPNPPGVEPQDG